MEQAFAYIALVYLRQVQKLGDGLVLLSGIS